jgi:dTDP-4-dehydrorhamnose reductase
MPHDQFATPVYAGDIARMLYLLLRDGKNGIYNLSSTDYYNRHQLAKKVKSYFPLNTSVQLKNVTTNELKQAAVRPLNGGLLNIKFTLEYPDFQFTNIDSFINRIINL